MKTSEKIQKTKELNNKKLGEFRGYEIWIDSKNFVTVKDGIQHYYGSLYQLFYKINLEVNQRAVVDKDLENIAKSLQTREEHFLADLKTFLGGLSIMEPEDLVKKLQ